MADRNDGIQGMGSRSLSQDSQSRPHIAVRVVLRPVVFEKDLPHHAPKKSCTVMTVVHVLAAASRGLFTAVT